MENNNNSGAIFKNIKKADNHPDYRGGINVEGKEYDIALWLRESKKGVKYFSVAISEPYKKDQEATNQDNGSDGENLPF